MGVPAPHEIFVNLGCTMLLDEVWYMVLAQNPHRILASAMPSAGSFLVVAKISLSLAPIASIFSCCAERTPTSAATLQPHSSRLSTSQLLLQAWKSDSHPSFKVLLLHRGRRWLASGGACDCNLLIKAVIAYIRYQFPSCWQRIATSMRVELHDSRQTRGELRETSSVLILCETPRRVASRSVVVRIPESAVTGDSE